MSVSAAHFEDTRRLEPLPICLEVGLHGGIHRPVHGDVNPRGPNPTSNRLAGADIRDRQLWVVSERSTRDAHRPKAAARASHLYDYPDDPARYRWFKHRGVRVLLEGVGDNAKMSNEAN